MNRICINRVRQGASFVITKILLFLGIILNGPLAAPSLQAGPIDIPGHPDQKTVQLVHEAEHEVDHAWEVHHRAALGGTVASPRLQAEIEEQLHQARTLITQAHEAADHGDSGQVASLVKQVRIHTIQAIEGSKESKK